MIDCKHTIPPNHWQKYKIFKTLLRLTQTLWSTNVLLYIKYNRKLKKYSNGFLSSKY